MDGPQALSDLQETKGLQGRNLIRQTDKYVHLVCY